MRLNALARSRKYATRFVPQKNVVAVGHSRMSRIESIVRDLIKDMLYNRGSRVVDRRVSDSKTCGGKVGMESSRVWPDPDVRTTCSSRDHVR
jgi:hypothetical protein